MAEVLNTKFFGVVLKGKRGTEVLNILADRSSAPNVTTAAALQWARDGRFRVMDIRDNQSSLSGFEVMGKMGKLTVSWDVAQNGSLTSTTVSRIDPQTGEEVARFTEYLSLDKLGNITKRRIAVDLTAGQGSPIIEALLPEITDTLPTMTVHPDPNPNSAIDSRIVANLSTIEAASPTQDQLSEALSITARRMGDLSVPVTKTDVAQSLVSFLQSTTAMLPRK